MERRKQKTKRKAEKRKLKAENRKQTTDYRKQKMENRKRKIEKKTENVKQKTETRRTENGKRKTENGKQKITNRKWKTENSRRCEWRDMQSNSKGEWRALTSCLPTRWRRPLPSPSLLAPLPIPNLSRGENRALHNAPIPNTAPSTVRRIRPLPTFFAPRPFLYKAFYSGVGGGGGAGGGEGLDTGCNAPEQFRCAHNLTLAFSVALSM